MEKEIVVYGAKVLCASCVGAPSSEETYEWLQAALGRKYPDATFHFHYVDFMKAESEAPERQAFAERVVEEDLFYPVIVMDGEIIAEGIPNLLEIYRTIDAS